MPTGDKPPKGAMPSATLSVVQNASASYNSFTKGFSYGGSNYFLGYERGASDNDGQWFYGTSADIATNNNPLAKMTSATWAVIHNGTYDSNDMTWDYSSNTYELIIEEVSGDIYATAVEI